MRDLIQGSSDTLITSMKEAESNRPADASGTWLICVSLDS